MVVDTKQRFPQEDLDPHLHPPLGDDLEGEREGGTRTTQKARPEAMDDGAEIYTHSARK